LDSSDKLYSGPKIPKQQWTLCGQFFFSMAYLLKRIQLFSSSPKATNLPSPCLERDDSSPPFSGVTVTTHFESSDEIDVVVDNLDQDFKYESEG